MRVTAALVCGGLLASLVLAACGSSMDGPLKSTDSDGIEVCVPQDANGRAVITTSEVHVSGEDSVTVVAVSLVDAQEVELIGHDFGQFGSDFAMNGPDYDAYGPSDDPTSALEPGESYAVKVGLASAPAGGRAAGVEIEYRVGDSSESRTARTRVVMAVAPAGEVCSG